ncbi:retinal cone rhodopsin-sensitive cGMP 3',5'-cyclic phosphodiesterase subunit gamma isoform X3 [Pan troglodytes]|uniref:retinal cone rhodopsin-sensitive cGMP 3',5'-cyclic phosphodiesterase subunit gamma isoform X3 n=1 Tax=Pan troglodytes TaxID=9598 RepID=UPI003013A427
MSDNATLAAPASNQGPTTPRKGPPKFKQRQTRQFKSKPPKKGVKGFGDDIPGMEGLGTERLSPFDQKGGPGQKDHKSMVFFSVLPAESESPGSWGHGWTWKPLSTGNSCKNRKPNTACSHL